MTSNAAPNRKDAKTIECPSCGNLSRVGTLLCDHCGTSLTVRVNMPMSTRMLMSENAEALLKLANVSVGDRTTLDVGKEIKAIRSGTSIFEATTILRVYLEGYGTPLLLRLTQKRPVIMGRRDSSSPDVDVDLTPYGAYERGISRRHAALELEDKRLELWDMGSSNGTYLNGVLLDTHQRQQLRDGDQIRLGQLVMQLVFQQKIERK